MIKINNARTGLVLTGGGARAAYQVGVLKAISGILRESGWSSDKNPFGIICGTSAGAINGSALACSAENFGAGVRKLVQVWSHMDVSQVYRADSIGMLRSGAKWLSILSFGWMLRQWHRAPPTSLLDNAPLGALLDRLIDFSGLEASLASGALKALAVTASSYTTGQHLTFYQTLAPVEPWIRSQRMAQRDCINTQHLLASAAIPFIFPSVPLKWDQRMESCGDGSMRQLAPISPAIHLGAEKILIIGAGRLSDAKQEAPLVAQYPSIAQIAGHAMSSIFLDSLAVDIERLNRINKTVALLSDDIREKTPLRPIKTLVIAPSQRIDEIASKHVKSLPLPVRSMLGGIGATEVSGSALASYLLFESDYTIELIQLGMRDTFSIKQDVLDFFASTP